MLGTPQAALQIKSLGVNAKLLDKPISEVTVLGSDEKLKWSQTDDALVVEQPQHQPNPITLVLKVVTRN